MTAQHKTLISKTYHKLCTDINIMLEDGWHRDGVTTIIDIKDLCVSFART